jgi:FAD-dependent oxidoreductase domain-containing protein 1
MKCSIAIIGGGIIGSAAAYFLARSGHAGSIAVIEPDPTYSLATTPQGAGGVRQQFSLADNIAMSKFSLDFYKSFDQHMSDIPNLPDINFPNKGICLS